MRIHASRRTTAHRDPGPRSVEQQTRGITGKTVPQPDFRVNVWNPSTPRVESFPDLSNHIRTTPCLGTGPEVRGPVWRHPTPGLRGILRRFIGNLQPRHEFRAHPRARHGPC